MVYTTPSLPPLTPKSHTTHPTTPHLLTNNPRRPLINNRLIPCLLLLRRPTRRSQDPRAPATYGFNVPSLESTRRMSIPDRGCRNKRDEEEDEEGGGFGEGHFCREKRGGGLGNG